MAAKCVRLAFEPELKFSCAGHRELAVGAEELRPPSAWNRSNKVKDSAQFGGVQPEVLSAKLREAAEERSQNMYAELDRQVEAVTSGLDPIQLAKKQFPYHRKGGAFTTRLARWRVMCQKNAPSVPNPKQEVIGKAPEGEPDMPEPRLT
eukprot:gene24290-29506_t